MTTFSQLIAQTTEAAVLATLKTAGAIVNFNIDALPDNSVFRTILVSILPRGIYEFAGTIAEIAKGGFLDWAADGPYLEMLGEQMFGVERIRLTFATCSCTFTNASVDSNRYEFFAGQVRVKDPSTGKVYKAPAFTLEAPGDALDRDVVTVTVIAEEAGTGSNADAGDITSMVTTFDGVTVTNPTAAVGTDLEKRANYVARCRVAAAGASPYGPSQIYDHIAKGATNADGVSIGITKTNIVADTIDGTVILYMAKDAGVPNGDELNIINPLLEAGAVPGGVDFTGAAAAQVVIDIEYTATALRSAGLTDSEIEDLVDDKIDDLFTEVPIGGWDGFFYLEKLRATIAQAQAAPSDPRPNVNVVLADPLVDTPLAPNQVAIKGLVTPHIVMI